MHKTQHKIWLFGLLLLFSQSSFALSLGQIKVLSTFAQPFLAEITLPSYNSEEMESIQIHLASKEQFNERNIEMSRSISEFRFSVEEHKDGTLYIKVQSAEAVKELSISFLLEVTWNGGRIIKAYDVLLTPEAITEFWEQRAKEIIAQVEVEMNSEANMIAPPVLNTQNQQTMKKKNTPVIRQSTTQVASTQKRNALAHNQNKIRKTSTGGLEYSAVGRGESLSIIAQRIRTDPNMSINQVMVALFDENRNAFVNNDINRLLAGATLKIADMNTISSISKQEASQLAQKYLAGPDSQERQELLQQANRPMLAESEAEENITEIQTFEPDGNRLEISSANEEPIPQEILDEIKNQQIAVEEELKQANSNLEIVKLENTELKERISRLETELDNTAESLFLATIQQETAKEDAVQDSPDSPSATQQDQNLIVTNTDLGMAGNEKLSLMQRIEKYQTAISISSLTLLSMTIFGIRKKDIIINAFHNLKDRMQKSKIS